MGDQPSATHARACPQTKYKHACMHLHSSAQRNCTYHAQMRLMRAGYVLHSLECLKCRVVAKCCSNVLRSIRAYGVGPKAVRTYVCEKGTIQRTCVAHDARSYSHNRERGHIHPCIRAYRYTKYKHACMPYTYTYLHSNA
jgi:hypothetical protein